VQLNRGRLWRRFLFELLLLIAPLLLGLLVGLLGAWPFVPAGIATGVLLTLPLRYPFRTPSSATVMALMSDPGASPVRGQSVRLDGKPIGRVQAGFIAGEDYIFQDKTGLMAVDFRSMLGLLGNLFAGWKRVPSISTSRARSPAGSNATWAAISCSASSRRRQARSGPGHCSGRSYSR
jgi:hypothetical protein